MFNQELDENNQPIKNELLLGNGMYDPKVPSTPPQFAPRPPFPTGTDNPAQVGLAAPLQDFDQALPSNLAPESYSVLEEQQSGPEQLGNALARGFFGETIGGTLQAMGGLLDNRIINYLTQTEGQLGQMIYDAGRHIQESTNEQFPIYSESRFDPGWWASGLASSMSVLSSMIPGMAVARGTMALGKMAGMSTAASAALASGIGSGVMRHSENYREAEAVRDSVYQRALDSGLGYEEALSRASEAAAVDYKVNALNYFFDLAQLSSVLKPLQVLTRNAGRLHPDVGRALSREVSPWKYYAEKVGKQVALQTSEGVEEMINEIGSMHAQRTDNGDLSETISDALGSPQAWDAFIWGTAGGALFQGVGAAFNKEERLKVSEKLADISEREKLLQSFAATIKNNPGDEVAIQEKRNQVMFDYAMSAVKAGNVDLALEQLSDPKALAAMGIDQADPEAVKQLKTTLEEVERSYKNYVAPFSGEKYNAYLREAATGLEFQARNNKAKAAAYEKDIQERYRDLNVDTLTPIARDYLDSMYREAATHANIGMLEARIAKTNPQDADVPVLKQLLAANKQQLKEINEQRNSTRELLQTPQPYQSNNPRTVDSLEQLDNAVAPYFNNEIATKHAYQKQAMDEHVLAMEGLGRIQTRKGKAEFEKYIDTVADAQKEIQKEQRQRAKDAKRQAKADAKKADIKAKDKETKDAEQQVQQQATTQATTQAPAPGATQQTAQTQQVDQSTELLNAFVKLSNDSQESFGKSSAAQRMEQRMEVARQLIESLERDGIDIKNIHAIAQWMNTKLDFATFARIWPSFQYFYNGGMDTQHNFTPEQAIDPLSSADKATLESTTISEQTEIDEPGVYHGIPTGEIEKANENAIASMYNDFELDHVRDSDDLKIIPAAYAIAWLNLAYKDTVTGYKGHLPIIKRTTKAVTLIPTLKDPRMMLPDFYKPGTKLTLEEHKGFNEDGKTYADFIKKEEDANRPNHFRPIAVKLDGMIVGYLHAMDWLNPANVVEFLPDGTNNLEHQRTLLMRLRNKVMKQGTLDVYVDFKGAGWLENIDPDNPHHQQQALLSFPEASTPLVVSKNGQLYEDKDNIFGEAVVNPNPEHEGVVHAVVPVGNGEKVAIMLNTIRVGKERATALMNAVDAYIKRNAADKDANADSRRTYERIRKASGDHINIHTADGVKTMLEQFIYTFNLDNAKSDIIRDEQRQGLTKRYVSVRSNGVDFQETGNRRYSVTEELYRNNPSLYQTNLEAFRDYVAQMYVKIDLARMGSKINDQFLLVQQDDTNAWVSKSMTYKEFIKTNTTTNIASTPVPLEDGSIRYAYAFQSVITFTETAPIAEEPTSTPIATEPAEPSTDESDLPDYFGGLYSNELFGLDQGAMEFNVNTLNHVSQFLENIGIAQRLVPQFLAQDGSVIKGALASANFIEGTVDIIDEFEKRPRAWNKLPEEAAHWWYRLLKQDSPLKQMLWDAHKTALKRDELYAGQYGRLVNSPEELTEESIGQLIAEAIDRIEKKNASDADYSFFKKFLEWINKMLSMFKSIAQDPFEVAAMKILSSDMTDLMSYQDYKALNDHIYIDSVMDEQSAAPIDYSLIEDLGFPVRPQTAEENTFGHANDKYYFSMAVTPKGEELPFNEQSPKFDTQEELDMWIAANYGKIHDKRQKIMQREVEDRAKFFDRLLNKTFKKKSKYLTKTLSKYYKVIERSTAVDGLGFETGRTQLPNFYAPHKNPTVLIKRLDKSEKQALEVTNNYTNITPTIKVLPLILEKYKKHPIVLSEPLKVDGLRKQEGIVIEAVKGLIIKENPDKKTITAEDLVNEVYNFLATNYMLGFANEREYLGYRVDQTFTHVPDRDPSSGTYLGGLPTDAEIQAMTPQERERLAQGLGLLKRDGKVQHNKVSLRFNDHYHTASTHFSYSPSAWGNLTYFYSNKASNIKDAVLLHEIQNDNIERIRAYKPGAKQSDDIDERLESYRIMLHSALMHNETVLRTGTEPDVRIDLAGIAKRERFHNNQWLHDWLLANKTLVADKRAFEMARARNMEPIVLRKFKESIQEQLDLYDSHYKNQLPQAREMLEKRYTNKQRIQDFIRRGGIKMLITEAEIKSIKDKIAELNTDDDDFDGTTITQRKDSFEIWAENLTRTLRARAEEIYGVDATHIIPKLQAPGKALPPRQRNPRVRGHYIVGNSTAYLNTNMDYFFSYNEKYALETQQKLIVGAKLDLKIAYTYDAQNKFLSQLSKITKDQFKKLAVNFTHNMELLETTAREQGLKDIAAAKDNPNPNVQAKTIIDYIDYDINGDKVLGDYNFVWGAGDTAQDRPVALFIPEEQRIGDTDPYVTNWTSQQFLDYAQLHKPELFDIDQVEFLITQERRNAQALEKKALDTVEQYKKSVKKVEETDISDLLEREMGYFTPLIHHLIQKHIKAHGKDMPMYFSGYNITKLTQGNLRTARIYAGKEEVKYTKEEVEDMKFAAAVELELAHKDSDRESALNKLAMFKKASPANAQRVNNLMDIFTSGAPYETGAIYNAMSQISGIKLKWQESIPGLIGNPGGYLVDLTNYNYTAPILYGLDQTNPEADYTPKSFLIAPNTFDGYQQSTVVKVMMGAVLSELQRNPKLRATEIFNDLKTKFEKEPSPYFKDVLAHFDAFKQEALDKLERLDFIKVNKRFKDIIILDDEDIPEDQRMDYIDDRTLYMDPKESMSGRLRQFFTFIPSGQVSFLGNRFPEFKDFDEVINFLHTELVGIEPDFNKMIAHLDSIRNKQPWIGFVITKLNSASDRIRNEFVVSMRKQYARHRIVLWVKRDDKVYDPDMNMYVKTGTSSYYLDVIDSDRGSVAKVIESDWYDNLVRKTKLVVEREGRLFISPKEAREIANAVPEVSAAFISGNVAPLQAWLLRMGVDMSEAALLELSAKPNKYFRMEAKDLFNSPAGVFNIMVQRLQAKEEATEEETSEETLKLNNPLINNSGIAKLAAIDARFKPYVYSNSFRNSDNNTVYSYSMPTYLSDRAEKLKKDTVLLNQLKGSPFSSTSTYLKDLMLPNSYLSRVFGISYVDGLNKMGGGQAGTRLAQMSPREHEIYKLAGHTNGSIGETTRKVANYFFPTFSDKTRMTMLTTVRHNTKLFYRGNKIEGFHPETRAEIHALLQAEVNRMAALKVKPTNLASYNEGGKYFTFFPELNDQKKYPELWINGWFDDTNIERAQALAEEYVLKLVDAKKLAWRRLGLTETETIVTDGKRRNISTMSFIDQRYMKDTVEKRVTDPSHIVDFIAADYVVNNLIALGNMFQLFVGDPALYWKKAKTKQPTWQDHMMSTYDNLGKRLAAMIAPGHSLADSWKEKFNYVFLEDNVSVSKNIDEIKKMLTPLGLDWEPYTKIEGTDAQEMTTLKEHLTVMNRLGRVSQKQMDALLARADEETLSTEDLKFILQPIKPVYTNSLYDGTYNIHSVLYVKTSSFPLIPQLTRNTELDKLRVAMEEEGIDRAAYNTGVKVGGFNSVNIWNEEDNQNLKTTAELKTLLKGALYSVPRDGFRIQQEVPYDEDKKSVTKGSQETKLLFLDILDINFDTTGYNLGLDKTVTGEVLKAKYDKLHDELYQLKYDKLMKELTDNGVLNIKRLKDMIRKEAKGRDMSKYDIESIDTIPDAVLGERFRFPMWGHPLADKFESLLISIVNKTVVKQKMPGKSYVLGSENGIREVSGDVTDVRPGIVWVPGFNPKKGLNPQSLSGPAQVIAPFRFRDADGKLLNVRDFMVDNKLDLNRIPKELLQLFGFRIPTQGHNSMSYIEIVGFLPEESGDLIIAPKDFTKQMGSDFDVDKLYTYMYNTRPEYDKAALEALYGTIVGDMENGMLGVARGELRRLNKAYKAATSEDEREEIERDRAEILEVLPELSKANEEAKRIKRTISGFVKDNSTRDKALQNEIIDIHFIVMQNNEVWPNIMSALGFGDLPDLADMVQTERQKRQQEEIFPTILSEQYFKEKYINGTVGKSMTGIKSLDSTLNATIQGKGMYFYDPRTGERIPIIFEDHALSDLSGKYAIADADGIVRNKSYHIAGYQSAAVDNEKEQILGKINSNRYTAAAERAILQVGYTADFAVLLMSQDIILEYVEEMKRLSDSTTEGSSRDATEQVAETLRERYVQRAQLPKDYRGESDTKLTRSQLKEMLGDPSAENYAKAQLDVLEKFLLCNELGEALGDLQRSINTDSAGLGKNFLETVDKYADVVNHVYRNRAVANSGRAVGDVDIQGDAVKVDFKTINGFAIKYGLMPTNDLFTPLYPTNTPLVVHMYKELELQLGLEQRDSRLNNELKKHVWDSFKSYLFATDNLFADQDVNSHRMSLLYDHYLTNPDGTRSHIKKSLATETKELAKSPQGMRNTFLQKLTFDISIDGQTPSLIGYTASKGENYDEDDTYQGLIDLLQDNDTTILARDLIAYSYLTGGIQKATNFVKYVPPQYLINIGVAKFLRDVNFQDAQRYGFVRPTSVFSVSRFTEQFIQHNANLAMRITNSELHAYATDVTTMDEVGNPVEFRLPAIPMDAAELAEFPLRALLIKKKIGNLEVLSYPNVFAVPIGGSGNAKSFNSKSFRLYKMVRMESGDSGNGFVEISTLGGPYNFTEYDPNVVYHTSIVDANQTRQGDDLMLMKYLGEPAKMLPEPPVTIHKSFDEKYTVFDLDPSQTHPTSEVIHLIDQISDHAVSSENRTLAQFFKGALKVIGSKVQLRVSETEARARHQSGVHNPPGERNIININITRFKNRGDEEAFQSVVLHELGHELTSDVLIRLTDEETTGVKNTVLTDTQRMAHKTLKRIMRDVKQKMLDGEYNHDDPRLALSREGYLRFKELYPKRDKLTYEELDELYSLHRYYAFEDVHEFATMVLSDPEIRAAFNLIPYSESTLLNAVLRWIKELLASFGFVKQGTLLQAAMEPVVALVGYNPTEYVEPTEDPRTPDTPSSGQLNLFNEAFGPLPGTARRVMAQEDMDAKVASENQYMGIINELSKRQGVLKDALAKAKLKKDIHKVAQVEADLEALSKKIDLLQANRFIEYITQVGEAEIQEVRIRLTNKASVDELVYLLELISLWKNATHLLGEDIAELGEYSTDVEKIRSIQGQAAMLYDQWVKIGQGRVLSMINEKTGINAVMADVFGPSTDIDFFTSMFRDLSTTGDNLLQFVDLVMREAAADANNEYLDFQKELESTLEDFHKTAEYRRNKYNIFLQRDEDGKRTGDLVNYKSKTFTKTLSKYIRATHNKKANWRAFGRLRSFKKGNTFLMDPRLLMYDTYKQLGGSKTYTKENIERFEETMKEVMGENVFEHELARVRAKVEAYMERRQAEELAIDNRIAAEGLDPSSRAGMLAEWERWRSPFAYAEWLAMNDSQAANAWSHTRHPSAQYVVEVPQKYKQDNTLTGYWDPQYETIANDPVLSKTYNFLHTKLNKYMKYLPEHVRQDSRYYINDNTIPEISRRLLEEYNERGARGWLAGVQDNLIQSITQNIAAEYSSGSMDIIGRERPNFALRMLPQRDDAGLGPEEKSYDLGLVLDLFARQAIMFRHKVQVQDLIYLTNDLLQDVKELSVSPSGKTIKNVFTKEPIKLEGLKYKKAMLDYAVKAFHGQKREVEGATGKKVLSNVDKRKRKKLETRAIQLNLEYEAGKMTKAEYEERLAALEAKMAELGSNFVWSRLGDTVIQYMQLKGLGWNVLSGTANVTYGILSNLIHAAGQEDFDTPTYMKALGLIMSTAVSPWARNKVGRLKVGDKIAALIERFDVLKEITDNEFDTFTANNKAVKGLKKLAPYELQRRGEYVAQGSMFLAMLQAKKIMDKHGNEKTWFDAFNENGTWNEADFGPAPDLKKFKMKVDQVIKRNHGNYDPNSFVQLKRWVLGRMVLQFRSWIAEGFAARFESEKYDMLLERNVKGRWRSYASLGLQRSLKTVARQAGNTLTLGKVKSLTEGLYEGLSPLDAANMRKNYMELKATVMVAAAIMALTNALEGDDDDENKKRYRLAINYLTRLENDIFFYGDPESFESITQNPLPVFKAFNDVRKWLLAIGNYVVNGEEGDTIPTGINADESELGRTTAAVVPGAAAVQKFENATKRVFGQ